MFWGSKSLFSTQKEHPNLPRDIFFTPSFFKNNNFNIDAKIKKILKLLILVILFTFSLTTLFTLENIFFNNSEKIGHILKTTSFQLKESNFISITRSIILIWFFLISSLTNFTNINSAELKIKKYWPWMICYFAFSILAAFLYFFLKVLDIKNLFYIAFVIVGFVIFNFIFILFQEVHEFKVSPISKSKMIALIVSYSLKFFGYAIFYILFYIFVTSGTDGLLFKKNFILELLITFLSSLNNFSNVISLFFIVTGTLLLWLFSNLNYLFYLKETIKNPSKFEALFYFGTIIGFSILIWFSRISFGNFRAYDLIWGTEKQWFIIYIVGGFNAIILFIFLLFLFNNRVQNSGPLINNLVYSTLTFLIWKVTIILVIFNRSYDENFKILWISNIITMIMFILHYLKFKTFFKGFNGIIVGLNFFLLGLNFAFIGFNTFLEANGNFLNVNNSYLTLNQFGYLFIFIIAFLQLVIFLIPYLLIVFNVRIRSFKNWIFSKKIKKIKRN